MASQENKTSDQASERRKKILAGVLMVAGILTLMVLARGKTGDDGDIAGVVAQALLLTCVSGVVAVVAAVRQKRSQRLTPHL